MRREDSACLDDEHQASEADKATAAEAITTAVDEEGAVPDGGEELAADAEVARLLSELQADLNADGSDDSDAEEGEDAEREGEGGEDARNDNEDEDEDSSHECSEAAGGKPEPDKKDAPSPATAREQQQQELQQPAESSLTRPAESQPQAEPCGQDGQEGGQIDISRMKIDAPHHRNRQRGGPRPRSAPSTCLSAGGFSRLSSRASSSSRLSRTVSQKLIQAMKEKEAEEQRAAASSEAQGRGGAELEAALRQRSINVVKQNAEALQVRHACSSAVIFQAGAVKCSFTLFRTRSCSR